MTFVVLAIAEFFKNEGDDELKKKNLSNAIHLYSEGIKVRCKDGELKAKLYRNRSAAHFKLGEEFCKVLCFQYDFILGFRDNNGIVVFMTWTEYRGVYHI